MVIEPDLPPSRASSVTLLGGELALDFANTESGRGHVSHQDHLQQPRDVADWLEHAKAVAPPEAAWLRAEGERRSDVGEALLARARALRQDIHAIAAAIARKRPPEAAALERLNAFHGACLACGMLRPAGSAFHWAWDIQTRPIEAALGPITMSAISILTGLDLARVKECGGEHCGWIFYDHSKNNSRRWCEMEICGNRAKQRRLRARRGQD
jgi:predicted RNA-binding Zn ribbon-like protein